MANTIQVRVIRKYKDLSLNRVCQVGDVIDYPIEKALELQKVWRRVEILTIEKGSFEKKKPKKGKKS